MPLRWHILTGEFPPATGGVGDYTAQLASELQRAGDRVTVWTPGQTLPDCFGRATTDVLQSAFRESPGIVLLQYVPNALGARGMNLGFCRWLRAFSHEGADVRVMFHEPYFYFTAARPWRNVLALVQRLMARTLIDASKHVYVSTNTWRRYLHVPAATPFDVLPIPSNIPCASDAGTVDRMRHAIGADASGIVGHFGTYGDDIADALLGVLPAIAARVPAARFAFIGAGSREFVSRLAGTRADIASRSWASGHLDATAVSSALRACDLLAQPYPDGITTRRTSAMAGLQHGVPTITTSGALTETVWAESRGVSLARAGSGPEFAEQVDALLRDRGAAAALGRRGADTYLKHFSLQRTLAVLRSASADTP
jgi:glycosyltransferase involved in cell wall biosynthesis